MIRIALAQINTVVGDLKGNSNKIIEYISYAKAKDVDLIAFPELSLCGYPPEDLLLKPSFINENKKYLKKIIDATENIFIVLGFPYFYQGMLHNAAAFIYRRKLVGIYKKIHLPNYDVFDELRYFKPGDAEDARQVIRLKKDLKIGVNICEDIWNPDGPQRTQCRAQGAKVIINISASPYYARKIKLREKMLRKRAKENNAFVFYCNSVGGQDELVFDGASMAFDPKGRLIARAKQFEEDMLIVDLKLKERTSPASRIENLYEPLEEIYRALLLGFKDYVSKNGFEKVVLGLSGGIDSAFVSVLSVDALGKDNVVALIMPSVYSSKETRRDAKILAGNLGIRHFNIPINNIFKTYLKTLKTPLANTKPDITEENLQARIRGNILMAISNKFGWMVVTTGNKSELSVGYCTLYGDTVGGFAVIKDVPKTLVYKLARHRNEKGEKKIIPESILERAPSAELKKDQKDQDILPSYSKLDKIIDAYIEKDHPLNKITREGLNPKMVRRIISMIDRNEYKRRQSPVGVKITPKAFGKDRRMPITNKFYE